MAFRERLMQLAEERLGQTVVSTRTLERLTEVGQRFEEFRAEASELAYHALDYFGGRPQEMLPEKRNTLAQMSRVALMEDPLAGAEADLLSNFAFGRGVPVPQAIDEKVQEIIDEAWSDPVNQQKLTSFEAQRHRSNELLTQANLFPVAFPGNGRVRLGFLDADTVTHIVCDPDDDERPLWYVSRKRRIEWDFEQDRGKGIDEMRDESGRPKVIYYPHWQNVEDARKERKEDPTADALEEPPEEKKAVGLVEHIRINRIGRAQFGTPPWARSLRFFNAMNDLTEAHVAMAQASATFIAKRVIKGGPTKLTQAANSVLNMTGEIGSARFGQGPPPADVRATLPPSAGSHWLENDSDRLEALNLQSGAGQAAQTASIVRAPIAAAAGFGQHYLGDASNANLATATSLELPALMNVQAWQETFRQLMNWFTDMAVQEALRAGRLGGGKAARVGPEEITDALDGSDVELTLMEAEERAWDALSLHERALREKPLEELRISEAEDKGEAERRTGVDLGYSFSMPYPGRRNLPDVVAAVTQVAAGYDPNGVNAPLRRGLLYFLATHGLQLDDPQGWVDEVMPEPDYDDLDQKHLMPGINPETGEPYEDPRANPDPEMGLGGGGSSGGQRDREKPKGARSGRSKPSDEMGEALRALGEETAGLFDQAVIDPLLRR